MSDQDVEHEQDTASEPEENEENEDALTEEDEFEFPPPKRRHPFALITAIVLIIVIVGGGLLAAHTVGGRVLGLFPTPTPTLIPGENLFYITTSPAWGKVSIDGHAVSHLPEIGSTPLTLATGGHTIRWDALPFPPQQCLVYVPPQLSTGGACSASSSEPVQSGKDSGLPATIISFAATFSSLRAAQRTTLLSATQKAFDTLQSIDTVQPDEQYVDLNSHDLIATATQPLKATLRFKLDTNPNTNATCVAITIGGFGQSCQEEGGDCDVLCNGQGEFQGFGPASGSMWEVFGIVHMSYDYTTLSGQVIARNQPDVPDASNPDYLIPLTLSWNGADWSVSVHSAPGGGPFGPISPICIPAESVIYGNGVEASYFGIANNTLTDPIVNGRGVALTWLKFSSGPDTASGCLAVASPNPATQQTPVTVNASSAYCLYRFGVLLAANAQAHRYWPKLPVVDAYEQSIVQQLVSQS